MAQTAASTGGAEAGIDAALEKKAQKALFRSQVMSGTTPIQLKAKAIRSKMIMSNANYFGAGGKSSSSSSLGGNGKNNSGPSLFKETSFQYLGDTVVIWNLREYLDEERNPKWREDAIRRSLKRRQREASLAMASSNTSKMMTTTSSVSLSVDALNKSKKMSRKRRFRTIVEALYQKSLQENTNAISAASLEQKKVQS